LLEEGIVTITMLETCKWTHNKTPTTSGYYNLKFEKKKTPPTFSHGKEGWDIKIWLIK
jgi:hypothetical protein